jgi:hypothetical protein
MAPLPPDTEIEAIVVKFRDEAGVRTDADGRLTQKASIAKGVPFGALQASIAAIEAQGKISGYRLRRHFAIHPEIELDEWIERGRRRSNLQLSDLNSFYSMKVAPGTRYSQVAQIVDSFSRVPFVEVAYASPVPRNAQAASAPSFEAYQGYLDLPPNGIDARYGWNLQGGRGSGIRIVDVEYAWNTGHVEFPALFANSGNFNNTFGDDHGTAVVGMLAAPVDEHGTSGIATDAMIGLRSVGSGVSVAEAVQWAATRATSGGIVLIEQQRQGPSNPSADCGCALDQCNYVPVEYGLAEFSAIQAATANGVIVVEAAANGGTNLDAAVYGNLFNRNSRDSGAILVGAGQSAQRVPMCFSNYGSRVDVHGWGQYVTTMGYGDLYPSPPSQTILKNLWYTSTFGGTSSASPIVAGAAAIVQGVRLAAGQPPMNSIQMRSTLATSGTPQATPVSRQIGPLPNVRAAILSSSSGPEPDLSWLPSILQLLL